MGTIFIYFLKLLLLLPFLREKLIQADEDSRLLLNYLLTNYEPTLIPTIDNSKPLSLEFGISVNRILNVDEKYHTVKSALFSYSSWYDYRLQWNNSKFSDIYSILVPFDKIWTPSLDLWNSVDDSTNSLVTISYAKIYSTGIVKLHVKGVFLSSCEIDVTLYPFDVQTCYLNFNAWSYFSSKIILRNYEEEFPSIYQAGGEFDLEDFSPLEIGYIKIENDKEDKNISLISQITYVMKLRRSPLWFILNLIVPCCLINSIALMVFFIPCQTGEKVTLGVSSLVSMTVFLMNIKDSLPQTDIPIICWYYIASMFLVALATGLSALSLNVYFQGERKVPASKSLKYIFNILSKLLMAPQNNSTKKNYLKNNKISTIANQNKLKNIFFLKNETSSDIRRQKINKILQQNEEIASIGEKIIGEKKNKTNGEQEWKDASVILDRIFMIPLVAITLLSTIMILFFTP